MAVGDAQLNRFFEATVERYRDTTGRTGETIRDFRIAGRTVRIRFAGAGLSHLARPLEHVEAAPDSRTAAPSLDVLVWSGRGDARPPAPPWSFEQLHWFGEIAGLASTEFAVNYAADQGLLCMLHRPTGRAIYWLPDAAELPFWETAAPFRILFHWWAQSFGAHVTHAAAVGRNGDGILLVGRGGSGKSTTSIACVDSGMEYVGDDYVLLTRHPRPEAHSLYHSAKIHTKFLHASLRHWTSWVAGEIGPENKSLFFLREQIPAQVRASLRIVGIVQPRITSNPQARLLPAGAAQGLLAIAPSTMYQLPESRGETLAFFADWVRAVPAYLLQLGTDLTSAPRVLSQHLASEGVRRAA